MQTRPFVPRLIITVLFTVSGFTQFLQVPGDFFGDERLPMLGVLHIAAGIPGLLTAIGAWRSTRWAWLAALMWAATTAYLILSLESLLELTPEAVKGLMPAAGLVMVLGALAAWYLYRSARRAAGNAAPTAADR